MTIYSDITFPELADRPYTFVNMVTTVDGKAVAPDKAHPLFGGRADRAAMLELRAHADGLLYGATTGKDVPPQEFVEAEFQARRQELNRKPLMPFVMLSHGGHLADSNVIFQSSAVRPIVYIPSSVRLSLQNADVRSSGKNALDLPAIMADLKTGDGINTLLCEGGPGTNQPLLAAGLVDEFFVTINPQLFGGQAIKTIVEGQLLAPEHGRLELISHQAEGSELFLRYRILR